MARKSIFSIDPGRRGAVVVIESETGRLVSMENAFSDDSSLPGKLFLKQQVVVERPLAFPGTQAQSLITLAQGYGVAIALAQCAGVPTVLQPTAAQWKRAVGVFRNKRTSVEMAM